MYSAINIFTNLPVKIDSSGGKITTFLFLSFHVVNKVAYMQA